MVGIKDTVQSGQFLGQNETVAPGRKIRLSEIR
jgi:hypothetical protein